MKRLALFITISLLCFTTFVHADDEIIPAARFIEILGGKHVTYRSIRGVTIKMNFKFDSTELADQRSYLQLIEVGKALSSDKLSHIKVEIAGHTDSIGSSEYNLKLSQRRAEKIRNDLKTDYGISLDMLYSKGYGEENPVAGNDTEHGRAENRRVIIKRLK